MARVSRWYEMKRSGLQVKQVVHVLSTERTWHKFQSCRRFTFRGAAVTDGHILSHKSGSSRFGQHHNSPFCTFNRPQAAGFAGWCAAGFKFASPSRCLLAAPLVRVGVLLASLVGVLRTSLVSVLLASLVRVSVLLASLGRVGVLRASLVRVGVPRQRAA